ncbi:uncharacterized protein LOC117225611 isoform X1 [Megalopta genalis]|uniref:uncharacterized protein LOC117225611 isoform X1 n=1 Tax=Megalopta genalis TaxID=115081 RepID=UPI003FD3B2B8
MEVFDGNYKFYHTLMCLTGLWPYDKSILTYIQRFVVLVMTFTCIASQICILTSVKVSLNEIIVMISFGSTLFLYFLRYSTSVVLFPVMTFVFDNMQRDFSQLKDPVELKILLEDSIVAKRIVQAYFASFLKSLGILLQREKSTERVHLLAHNTDNSVRFINVDVYGGISHRFRLLHKWNVEDRQLSNAKRGEHGGELAYNENNRHTVGYGNAPSCYFVGTSVQILFRHSNVIGVRFIMLLLRCFINLVTIDDRHTWNIVVTCGQSYAHRYTKDIMLLCLLLTLVVIVAFGVNLYGFFISITESNDRDAMMLSVHFVMAYTTFICGNNYSGQLVLDSSGELFRETYNSLWYRIPAKMQKLVLFSLMRSRSDVAFNLAGLFTPCYEGFTMMMSSSFSYFTLLCSV